MRKTYSIDSWNQTGFEEFSNTVRTCCCTGDGAMRVAIIEDEEEQATVSKANERLTEGKTK